MNSLRGRLRADENSYTAEQSEMLQEVRKENEKERAVLESQNEALKDEISQLRNQVNEMQVSNVIIPTSRLYLLRVLACYVSLIR